MCRRSRKRMTKPTVQNLRPNLNESHSPNIFRNMRLIRVYTYLYINRLYIIS